MIDFHAHILPKADHGCDSIETAKAQLEMAKDIGIDTIIATPHFYAHKQGLEDFLQKRDKAFLEVESIAQKYGIKVLKGAEVLLAQGVEKLPSIEKLTIGSSRHILIEMPYTEWTNAHLEAIYEIKAVRGLTPIIAHIDRYEKENTEKIFKEGYICQMNACALLGLYKSIVPKKWLKNGYISAIGSDIHMKGEQYNEYRRAIKVLRHFPAYNENEKELLRDMGI